MPRRGFVARHAAVLAATATLVAGACSSSYSSAKTGAATISGSIRVFAAASLTGAFTAGQAALRSRYPHLSVTFEFAGSNTLANQIQQSAPADVFASADQANMQKLVKAGLVDQPVTFATNKLEIAVAPGNPKHLASLADLTRPGVKVVLGAPGVPVGDYARRVLAAQHLAVSPISLETDVKSAIAKVASGEADAAIAYTTDVTAAGASVTGVAIPDAENVIATYPIAAVRASGNLAAARAFVESAVSGDIQHALEQAGFLPPR